MNALALPIITQTTAPHTPTPLTPPVRLAADRVHVRIATSLDELTPMREAWDQHIAALDGLVYSTFDWCRSWWEHYGKQASARVFVFHSADELVGIVPAYIEDVHLGPITLRVAKIMGTDFTQAIGDLPIRRSWIEACTDAILEQLIAVDRCDAIVIGPRPESNDRVRAFRAAARERGDLIATARDDIVGPYTTIDLPATNEAYLAGLSRNQRSNLRKEWKRLHDDFGAVTVETSDTPGDVGPAFETFATMHADQWERAGRLGHFRDWPEALPFNRRLVSTMSPNGRVWVQNLRVNESIIAGQYGFTFGRTAYCRLATRTMGPSWERYGLGRLSLIKLFEHAIERGIRRIDAGLGHYEYTLRLGGRIQPARTLVLTANRAHARFRGELFRGVARLVDRLYYRLWYCRVAPRLPGRHRPLRPAWVRSRFA